VKLLSVNGLQEKDGNKGEANIARSDRYSFLKKTPVYYSDFLNSFDVNPETGNLYQVTNEESVKQSIRNLVLTDRFERFYQPLIGSKIQSLLFDLDTPQTKNLIISTIVETIRNYEPRALEVTAYVDDLDDSDTISILVLFSLANVPEPIQLPLILNRIR
jgi:phage baseplate assembly protein W